MKKFSLIKTKKGILVIGVILLLLALGYRFFPDDAGSDNSSDGIEFKLEKIRKYQDRVGDKDVLEKRKAFIIKRLDENEKGLLKGETTAIAAVSMQNRLKEIAEKLSIDIKSTRVMKAEPVENATDMVSVNVQISTELTIRQLVEFIYNLENSENIIQVTDLQIRRKSEEPPIKLYTMMKICGFMIAPKKDI